MSVRHYTKQHPDLTIKVGSSARPKVQEPLRYVYSYDSARISPISKLPLSEALCHDIGADCTPPKSAMEIAIALGNGYKVFYHNTTTGKRVYAKLR